MSRTYKVQTPSGVLSRRTNRTYTHVVVTADDQRANVPALFDDRVGHMTAALADRQRVIANGGEVWDGWTNFITKYHSDWDAATIEAETAKQRAESLRRALQDEEYYTERLTADALRKLRARLLKGSAQRGSFGWAGRPDLAQKLLASTRRRWPNERLIIIEVPQV